MADFKRKRVLIHAGWHKTGSTAVQDWCFANAKDLASSGIRYPTGPALYLNGHHQVPWGLGVYHPYKTPNFRSLDFVKAELLKTRDHLILSSEDFEFMPERGVSDLKEVLSDCDVKILIFARNVIDYINADYQQNVRNLEDRFKYNLPTFCFMYNMHDRMNYFKLLNKWFHYFGAENVKVIPYGETGKSVIDHVKEEIGIGEISGSKNIVSNKSLRPVSVRTLQVCNAMYEKKYHIDIVQTLHDLEQDSDTDYTLISPEIYDEFLRRIKPNFQKIEEKFKIPTACFMRNTSKGKTLLDDGAWEERLRNVQQRLGFAPFPLGSVG